MMAKAEREIRLSADDAVRLLVLLKADPTTFVEYSTDKDGRLTSMLWATGQQQQDALLLSDTIIMDIVFLANRYVEALDDRRHGLLCFG